MLKLPLRTRISGLRSRQQLALENLALRHQIGVLQRTAGRPRLRTADRALWVILSRICRGWRRHLVVVQPDTVNRWHRLGWRLYWRRKSRPQRAGRPIAEPEVRALIRRLPQENPLWGAPRIHGELLMLGIKVSEATVAKYMIRRGTPPSQNWRTFIRNHLPDIVAVDFLAIPTVTFGTLYVLIFLLTARRPARVDAGDWSVRQTRKRRAKGPGRLTNRSIGTLDRICLAIENHDPTVAARRSS